MIVDLTLKPTSYKAVRIQNGVYNELKTMFGDALRTSEENFSVGSAVIVLIDGVEYQVPVEPSTIVVAEYYQNALTGIFASSTADELHRMFDWEGQL